MKIVFTYVRLLKLAWKQYYLRFDVILFSHLCITLPLNLAIDTLNYGQIVNFNITTIEELLIIIKNPWFIGLQALAAITNLWISTCVMLMIKANYQQELPLFKTIVQRSWNYFPRILLVSLLVGSFTILGFGLLILPGLIIWFGCSLALPALIWKDLQPWPAIRLSWKIVKRFWWIVPGYIFITTLFMAVVTTILAVSIPGTVGFMAIGTTISAIIQSYSTIVIMVLFVLLEEVDTAFTLPAARPPLV